jgi:gliding motility-associated-like protein
MLIMKKIVLLFIFLYSCITAEATHTKGGWMYYEYLGPGINDPAKLRYKIGLNYYIECGSVLIEAVINFSIFSAASPYLYIGDEPASQGAIFQVGNCQLVSCYPCITNIPFICYQVIKYETIVELDASPSGYIIAKQRCCRINFLSNLQSPSNAIGETYTINIPGVSTQTTPGAHINTSPVFNFNDTTIVCADNPFSVSFAATDADSLVYSLCDAFTGGGQGNPIPTPTSAPPFTPVPYLFPFSGAEPLGAAVTIDPLTGVVSGIAPASGEYVVTICVKEYRDGIHIADSRKELHLKVTPCTPVLATLDPTFLTCGDLTLSFQNNSDGPAIQNWFWSFGDPASGTNDSSVAQLPNHTFSAPGIYTIKLIVNRGLPCMDSATQVVSVFPGFFSGFMAAAPYCVGKPVQFNDTTRTNFGTVNSWQWNFGDNTTLADTSRLRNPTYTYSTPGTYTVKLISHNSLGCRDSITHDITILPSPVITFISSDTAYCGLDSIPLTATGTGNFSWTPGTNITGANTASPIVFPTIPTTYTVTLENAGCRSTDSVRLTPLFDLTNNINALPASICQEDTLLLTGSSNKATNVSWSWSPAGSVATPFNRVTNAFPLVTTTYTLQTRWGNNCVVSKNIIIPVKALALANAGPDAFVCGGQNTLQLMASGGNTYSWSPATGLSATNIANPTASPATTTSYVVAVGVTGCSKIKTDTVVITVRDKPVVNITNDTLICTIDTLQLNVAGPGTAIWSPAYMINNINTLTPLVSPDVPTLYRVRFTDTFGCYNDDSVLVDVKAQVTIDAGKDTSLCKSEGFTLRTTGDATSYTWIPNLYLDDNTLKNPFANPPVTTTYTLIGNIGKCQASSDIIIKVVPYPIAAAGPDQTICSGFDVQLNASGGSMYQWSPARFLSNTVIANPIVQRPSASMRYVVTVTDTLGCPAMVKDTVIVNVIPPVLVDSGPADTSVVEDQPLLLNATGALSYLWTPPTWLSNTRIKNPVANVKDSTIKYILTGTDANGCIGTDSIVVRVFKVIPDMYVPTAFTPNGDGFNDKIRPILIGMKSLTYFRVYNRFGEMVFETAKIDEGWNGIYKGKPQDTGTFVWMAQGVTFKGQVRTMKGFVVLIK